MELVMVFLRSPLPFSKELRRREGAWPKDPGPEVQGPGDSKSWSYQ
jgi:hypothetical protein